jgi:hypothetical protein
MTQWYHFLLDIQLRAFVGDRQVINQSSQRISQSTNWSAAAELHWSNALRDLLIEHVFDYALAEVSRVRSIWV